MYKFIQRKKKILLAIFGVLLMIVFIIPSPGKNAADRESTVIGKVGDEKITAGELTEATSDLRLLTQAMQFRQIKLGQKAITLLQFSQMRSEMGLGSIMQALQISWSDLDVQIAASVLMLREQPLTYAILQKEAKAAGMEASDTDIEQYVPTPANGAASADEPLKQALRRLLSVLMNFNRVAGEVKVTLPQIQSEVAIQQAPVLNILEFKAEDFMASAGQVTERQIEEIWRKHAADAPDSARTANSAVRFGYLQPEKVKLQYVRVPIDRVRNAAMHMLSEEDVVTIDRIAIPYYNSNHDEFTTLVNERDIVAGPFLKPSTRPDTKILKPFRQVRDELRRRIVYGKFQPDPTTPAEDLEALAAVKGRFEKLVGQIQKRYVERLKADYETHKKGQPIMLEPVPAPRPATQPTTQLTTQPASQPAAEPTTAPVAQPAPPFESVTYMEAVLQNVLEVAAKGEPLTPPFNRNDPIDESSDAFKPIGRALDDKWYTKSDLNAVTGISRAAADHEPFPDVVLRSVPITDASTQPSTQPSSTAPSSTAPAMPGPSTAPATNSSETAAVPASAPATGPSTAPSTQPVVGPRAKSVWETFQPSPLLQTSANEDAFVFRLTAYEPQRVPPLAEVKDKIAADLKLEQAYAAARKKADSIYQEVLKDKKESPNKGLAEMATVMHEKLIVAGPVERGFPILMGYDDLKDPEAIKTLVDLTAGASQQGRFAEGLVQKITTSNPHPVGIVDLPSAQRTVIVEIRTVVRGWAKEEDYNHQRTALQNLMSASQMLSSGGGPMQGRTIGDIWFSGDEVKRRTGYQSTGHGG